MEFTLTRPSRATQKKIDANRYLPALARGLVLGDFDLAEAEVYFRHFASLYSIGIDTNAICNLSCGYCYLDKYNRTTVPNYVDLNRLFDVLEEHCNVAEELDLVALVGKEPFADRRGTSLLQHLDRLSMHGQRFRFGVVTNGVLVDRHIDDIPPSIAYIDVSLDGTEAVTDRLRGDGVFRSATRNIRRLADRGFDIWVSAVLHAESIIPQEIEAFMVSLAEDFGCGQFYFSPLRNFTGSLENRLLSFDRIAVVQEAIIESAERHSSIRRVILDHPYEAVWRDYFWNLADGFDRTGELRIDEFGNILHPLTGRSFRKLDIFPHGPWGTCRIDAAGNFLWDVESRTFVSPESVGNVDSHSIADLHRSAVDAWLQPMLQRFMANMKKNRFSRYQDAALTTVSLPVL